MACGAEVLGAVNRCWKCGRPIAEDAIEIPPVSRDPVEGPLVRAFDARTGLPFDHPDDDAPVAQTHDAAGLPNPRRPRNPRRWSLGGRAGSIAAACTFASLLVGVFCVMAGFFYWWALFIGLAGLLLGLFGLASPSRRPVAIAGIVLCCIGMCAASFQAAIAVQQMLWPSGTL